MLNKLDAALSFHQNALRVRSQRQELIASNIANADTPNYKARDIDFKTAMTQALSNTGPALATSGDGMTKTSALHISGTNTNNNYAGPNEPLFRPIIQGSVDGNTVDMDVERNEFTDNAIRYEASITMISGQIKAMMAAIQGQ
jgi:flagellar basal-body rod protein FlgB